MVRGLGLLSAAVATLIACAACTVDQADTPSVSPTGPTDFAQSVSVTAIPDNLTQDGASQSSINVRVVDSKGQPASGVPIRLEIVSAGQVVDFGSLSTKSIVTGTDGRAVAVYTAPPAPPATAGGTANRVTIRATALGNNAQTSRSFTVDIRLVPTGVILPPAGTPTASFVVTPSTVTVGSAANFDASASQPGSGASSIISYTWSFGDGTTGSGQRVSHTYTTPNTFSVTLTVTNDRGLSASTTSPVNVTLSAAPAASFVFSPTNPAPGQTVNFNGSASSATGGHTITSATWDFGDGTTGSGLTTTHVFRTAATYSVVFVVTDDTGQRSTATSTVTVATGSTSAPTANFTFSPTTPAVGETIFFNGNSSTAGSGHTLVSASWDFGDGTTGSGATPTHAYSRASTFTVTLTVRDEAGQSASSSRTVTVTSAASTLPTPNFTFSPAAPGVGETVFFNASTSTAGPGRTITSYFWTFGDGTTASGVTPSHAYSSAGSYAVQLRVTDDAGQTATSSAQNINVGSPPSPTANFTVSPSNPNVQDLVVFDTAGTTTAQGQTIVRYDWNFGDGTPLVVCRNPSQSGDAAECTGNTTQPPNRTISHRFANAGTYTVNLVVTDSAGRTGATSRTVPVGTGAPTASFTSSVSDAPSHRMTYDGSASSFSPPATGITNYAWSFGDGASTSGGAAVVNRTYAAAGTYTVRLTVTDNVGRTGTTQTSVTVP